MTKISRAPKVDAVLMFDACMPRLELCRKGCQDDPSYFCVHRLDFKAEIVNANKYIQQLGFSDLQVVLHTIYIVRQKRRFRGLRRSAKVIIVTRDQHFVRDVYKELHEKTRRSWHKPHLTFCADGRIMAGRLTVHVYVMSTAPAHRKRKKDLPHITDDINTFWKRLKTSTMPEIIATT